MLGGHAGPDATPVLKRGVLLAHPIPPLISNVPEIKVISITLLVNDGELWFVSEAKV